jgi:NitT/TauT family transport system permease protein
VRYSKIFALPARGPNAYDILAIGLLTIVLIFFSHAAGEMVQPLSLMPKNQSLLSLGSLPYYSFRTFFRIILAMFLSIGFTLTVGALLAKYKKTRSILLPIIDILQSLPPLGFTSFLAVFFISLHPHSTLGLEMAAITTIFISQVWNMLLSFYKSLITLPKELHEACSIYQLTPWKKFWKVEVPFAIPSVIGNAMLSMSASWFFVVACEALVVSGKTLFIPGMGSFIYAAIEQQNFIAIWSAIGTMFLTIIIYDQLLLRPLLAWSEKFKADNTEEETQYESWFLNFLSRTQFLSHLTQSSFKYHSFSFSTKIANPLKYIIQFFLIIISAYLLHTVLMKIGIGLIYFSSSFMSSFNLKECLFVFYLGFITSIKVLFMVALSTLIWVPIGIQIGIRQNLAKFLQPIIQLLAAFPPTLFYPFMSTLVVHYDLNVDYWTMPLMILGTQWYILFNVIDGTRQMSKERRYAIENFHIKGWLKWKRFYLPSITPSIITGAMAAAGGCWNVCPESDIIQWGNTKLQATGLGAYIHQASLNGDFYHITLGMIVMAIYVIFINKFLWQPLLDQLDTYH